MVDLELTQLQLDLVTETTQWVIVILLASGLIGFTTVKLIKLMLNRL